MISIFFIIFILQRHCHWTCAIRMLERDTQVSVSLRMVVLVICVTENGSFGRSSSNPSGCKKFKYSFGRYESSRHMVSTTRYKTMFFIVMISNYSLKTMIRHIPLWII